MLTSEQITKAKNEITVLTDRHYEHDDCIRIAYEWLDAQQIIKNSTTVCNPIKHYIERWAGRYVSEADVIVAAHIHPNISGKYPLFNIHGRLIEPSIERLESIGEANTHNYREQHDASVYSRTE